MVTREDDSFRYIDSDGTWKCSSWGIRLEKDMHDTLYSLRTDSEKFLARLRQSPNSILLIRHG